MLFEECLEAKKKTEGQNIRKLKLLREDKTIPLLAKYIEIKIHDNVFPVDLLLLFQSICVKHTMKNLKNSMKYQLAPYPLFDKKVGSNYFRKFLLI